MRSFERIEHPQQMLPFAEDNLGGALARNCADRFVPSLSVSCHPHAGIPSSPASRASESSRISKFWESSAFPASISRFSISPAMSIFSSRLRWRLFPRTSLARCLKSRVRLPRRTPKKIKLGTIPRGQKSSPTEFNGANLPVKPHGLEPLEP